MKLLVAEDDRLTRMMLTKTLAHWGYEVLACEDGAEALRLARESGARIVLSDWAMPGLDGPTLCARLREEPTYVYVILLSAHRDPEFVVAGLDAGADDFVGKPFSAAELRARIAVGRRVLALQDELAARNAALTLANERLARIASTDALLDVGNRRSFEDALSARHREARQGGGGYAVILADLDRFKAVNDRLGHPVGDRALRHTVDRLADALGDRARLFRYGGEELVALTPVTSRDDAGALAERLRLAVREAPMALDAGPLALTVSLGVAFYDGREAVTAQVVVDRADRALYRAKHAGRDRVAQWARGLDDEA